MTNINVGRVLLGGLAAGVVLNIGEALLNGVLLAETAKADFARLHLPDPGGTFIARAVAVTFLLGIVLVYLYAAIRPRFGAGVKTAICAGLLAWFFVCLYGGYIQEALGLISSKLFLIGLVWSFVEYPIGAIVGAWLYKEA